MYGKWQNSEKTECPCAGHQRTEREHLIITASNDYSGLFNKFCQRRETDFYLF